MATQTVASKVRKSKVDKPGKICQCCHQKKPLEDFYSNKDWAEEQGRDAWCKECVQACKTKDDLRKYFYENRREWTEEFWDACRQAAEAKLSEKAVFNNAKGEMKEKMLNDMALRIAPTRFTSHYKFADKPMVSYTEAVASGKIKIEEKSDPGARTYSEFFNGMYTEQELKTMMDYYNNLDNEYVFDNETVMDYAKKIAKISLMCDKSMEDLKLGKCSIQDVNNLLNLFDMLNKSANFAACKRKSEDNKGITSWAETTMYLEEHGYCKENKIIWPKDSVDETIEKYKHVIDAVGLNDAKAG